MINVITKNNLPIEVQTKKQLEKLIHKHALSKYEFTNKVIIETNAIPHSHPILTLNTRYTENEDLLLSVYIHEQTHWFVSTTDIKKVKEAINDLKGFYPVVPVGYPDGAKDKYSTYLHLIINLIELIEMQKIVGNKRTLKVWEYLMQDHYTWIYRTVFMDKDKILSVVKKFGLLIP